MVKRVGRKTLDAAVEHIKDELGLVFDLTPQAMQALAVHMCIPLGDVVRLIDELREGGFIVADKAKKGRQRPRRYYVIEEELALDGQQR